MTVIDYVYGGNKKTSKCFSYVTVQGAQPFNWVYLGNLAAESATLSVSWTPDLLASCASASR